MKALAFTDPKTSSELTCQKTLNAFEAILPEADERQTDAILDWVRSQPRIESQFIVHFSDCLDSSR